MAITTVANVKEALGISGSESDALITNLIARTQARMERYCDRKFEQATYTDEAGDAMLTGVIVVKNPPIASVTSISVRSSGTTYTEVPAADYDFTAGDSGIVKIIGDYNEWCWKPWGSDFGGGINSYKITYVGGYASGSPELLALESIAIDIIAAAQPANPSARATSQLIQSESLGYQSYTYRSLDEAFSKFTGELDLYRRVSL